MMNTPKPYSEACERNREPILAVLRRHLAHCRSVLEIASGTGQHAVYFGHELPHLTWQTSDLGHRLDGIRAWIEAARLDNLPPPLALDVNDPHWPTDSFDAVFTANTAHILSWPEVARMFERVAKLLAEDGWLFIYGPFNYQGRYTSPSNARFDAWLKSREAHSGIRDFEAINELAQQQGLRLLEDAAMPANNRLLVWRMNK